MDDPEILKVVQWRQCRLSASLSSIADENAQNAF